MIKLTVYADVLIFLNTFVNFFILQLTSKICKDGYRLYRMIIASLTGAAFSLYIFLPSMHPVTENLLKLIISAVIVLICFGFDSIKALLRRIAVFFLASFLYGGLMLFIWMVLKPDNLAINNGIVYLDISPIILILATLISYICISIIRFFMRRQANLGKRLKLTIETDLASITTTALIDTGNSLTDSITGYSVIIIESSVAKSLLGALPTTESLITENCDTKTKFRLLPFSTVGGKGLIIAFKPNRVFIDTEKDKKEINNILIGISEEKLGEDYRAIINPDILSCDI